MFCYVEQWCDVWEKGLWGESEIKRQTEIIEIICERSTIRPPECHTLISFGTHWHPVVKQHRHGQENVEIAFISRPFYLLSQDVWPDTCTVFLMEMTGRNVHRTFPTLPAIRCHLVLLCLYYMPVTVYNSWDETCCLIQLIKDKGMHNGKH